jgi:hypothetical protein
VKYIIPLCNLERGINFNWIRSCFNTEAYLVNLNPQILNCGNTGSGILSYSEFNSIHIYSIQNTSEKHGTIFHDDFYLSEVDPPDRQALPLQI